MYIMYRKVISSIKIVITPPPKNHKTTLNTHGGE
jgi:hypothetical protein